MIISGSSRNSPERIEIQMWVRHAGYANLGTPAINLNLRGMWAALDFDSTPPEPRGVPIGQSCVVGAANADNLGYMEAAIGIVTSDLVIGRDCSGTNYNVRKWVNIQTYGHCDRIVCYTSVADWKYIWVSAASSEDGALSGLTRAEGTAARRLSGIFTFDGPPANGETINLDGTATAAGTWNAAPTVIDPDLGSVDTKPAHRILGWYYEGAAETVLEEHSTLGAGQSAILRKRQGFLCCMGLSIR